MANCRQCFRFGLLNCFINFKIPKSPVETRHATSLRMTRGTCHVSTHDTRHATSLRMTHGLRMTHVLFITCIFFLNKLFFYPLIIAVLFTAMLFYFKIADKFNIIDKPNERSSHDYITIRGGGIVFWLAGVIYFIIGLL